MHTVNWTAVFERQAKAAGLSFDDIFDIAATIAMDPLAGDLIIGSAERGNYGIQVATKERAAAIVPSITSRAKMCRFSCCRS
jgi:hypothetical protein